MHDRAPRPLPIQRAGALPVARVQGAHGSERVERSGGRCFTRRRVPAQGGGEAAVLGAVGGKPRRWLRGRECRARFHGCEQQTPAESAAAASPTPLRAASSANRGM